MSYTSAPADVSRQLAADLLSIGAVILQPGDPFTWSSGMRSPIYCDNRLTLAHPPIRRTIAQAFEGIIHAEDLLPATIAGTATAGIPHAAWLADRLDAPMAYVRSSAKGHGRKNQIEGRVEAGGPVVVVEDLVSTGGSAIDAVDALREVGAEVRAVLAIFSYELDAAAERFDEANIPLHVLTTFSTLIDVAAEQGDLSAEDVDTLRTWRADPQGWSAAHG